MVGKSLYTFRLRDYYGGDPTNGDALYRDEQGNMTNDFNKARYVYPASPEPKFTGDSTRAWLERVPLGCVL